MSNHVETVKNSPVKRKLSGDDQQSVSGSMETIQTVPADFVENYSDEEDGAEEETWGKLFPVGSSFKTFDLVKEDYSFGRGEDNDYQFNTPLIRKHPCFQAYSKIHFKIFREKTSTGTHVFLVDRSSNGTFVNSEKVGKGCKQVLNNNDEIALALPKNKAFVFMDLSVNEDANLPEELREKYTLSKLLGSERTKYAVSVLGHSCYCIDYLVRCGSKYMDWGACGEVKLAFEKGTCNKFAVKIIAKKKFSVGGKTETNMHKQVMNEVNILKSLKHPCIVNIEDLVDADDNLYIVLELVEGGELFDRVVSLGLLEEPLAKMLFYQMVLGVKYLHDQGIAHRDLKPENILLSSDSNDTVIKVTDFGLSKFVNATSMMKTFCGTPNYLAPEILVTAGNSEYTNAVDCWSLGVILYICLVGYPPFSDERKDMELPKQILGGHYDFPDEYWKDISNDAKDLVRKLLTVRPEQRITLQDALQHPWLQDSEVQEKAHNLMYPDTKGMPPPSSIPSKRKSDAGEEPKSKRKTKD